VFVVSLFKMSILVNHSQTLISSYDNCLSTYGFLLVMLSCLEPISTRSVRFRNVLEGNKPKTLNGGELINLGGVLQPLAYLGPSGSFNMKQPARLGEHVISGLSH